MNADGMPFSVIENAGIIAQCHGDQIPYLLHRCFNMFHDHPDALSVSYR
jgi:hypothetical protein